MNRAIRYRVYPTTEQSVMFAKTFGCCRKVYNLMLSDKIEGYKAMGKFPTVTPAKYKNDYPYLKEVDSLALANKQMDLQTAFRNTFSKSRKKKNGFPKFKSVKHSRKAYTTNNQKGTVAITDNYIKQLHKVNKIHRHIANQRLDNLHKISTKIANSYDVVCVESLNMKSMSNKGFGNGKATLDNGYGMFLSMLEYKLSDRNKYFIEVDKWFPSSQICHCCGILHPEMKKLAIRKMICDCGLVISRDQNAAINILNEGLRILNNSFAVA